MAAARSDVVAAGRIVQLKRVPRLSIGSMQLEKATIAKLIVDVSWRRSVSTLDIVTAFSDCDYNEFVLGRQYIVFAEYDIARLGKRDGMVWAPRCLPTQRREYVSLTEIRDLGQPIFTRKAEASGVTSARQPTSGALIRAAIIVAIVIVAAALIIRRR
jgi:hypothetical protein